MPIQDPVSRPRGRRPRRVRLALCALGGALGLWTGLRAGAGLPQDQSSQEPGVTTQPESTAGERGLRNPDGSWRFTNDLVDSSSPYLLQHAHNPVDWMEWGEEAFNEATRRDVPILVSVGYSTCYWCHVMERQVFENVEIAQMMNERFVCVKVDREQRPDVDEIYMLATQLTTGHGGWPNNVFVTPDLRPFFAGTYFGPEDTGGRPGFPTIIRGIGDAWENRRDQVDQAADRLTGAIRDALGEVLAAAPPARLSQALVGRAMRTYADLYDEKHGGFGAAPKFPQETAMLLLLGAAGEGVNAARAHEMVAHTLRRMGEGGIHDQVGGGFARYSVDARWDVPHFEKMLYNQAQMTSVYARAHEREPDPRFERVIRRTLAFVDRVMTGPDGQFYSALDAETDATEGAYYVWTPEQIRDVLPEEEAELALDVYDFAPVPRIPGHKHPEGGVLHWRRPVERTASELEMTPMDLLERLDRVHAKLLAARREREMPLLDDKVIVSWNALMIEALADAGRALDDDTLIVRAERAAEFVLGAMRRDDGSFWRIWRDAKTEIDAFHEDYAFLASALLRLHEVTGDDRWRAEAASVLETAERLFADPDGAGYFFTDERGELIARSKSPSEGAISSGNSMAVHAMLALHRAGGEQRWLDRADRTLRGFSGLMDQSPAGYAHMILALRKRLEMGSIEQPGLAADAEGEGPPAKGPLGAPEPVRVEAISSTTAIRPGEAFGVALRLRIDQGWHVNAVDPGMGSLIPLGVDVRSDAPIDVLEIEHPEAETFSPAFAEQPINVLAGEAVVVARVRLPASFPAEQADAPIEIRLVYTYQACDDSACLEPQRGVVSIALPIAETDEPVDRLNTDVFGEREPGPDR